MAIVHNFVADLR